MDVCSLVPGATWSSFVLGHLEIPSRSIHTGLFNPTSIDTTLIEVGQITTCFAGSKLTYVQTKVNIRSNMASSSTEAFDAPNIAEVTKISNSLVALAAIESEKALEELYKLVPPQALHLIQRLYVIGRLPTTPRDGLPKDFWDVVDQIADRLGASGKKSREQAMEALRKLTTHMFYPDASVERAVFERKFYDAPPIVWRELAAGFASLSNATPRIFVPLRSVIRIFNNVIPFRIIYYSNDVQREPTSLVQGDAHAACGMINNGIQQLQNIEQIEESEYIKANLQFDADGWVERIPGTQTIGKTDTEKEAGSIWMKEHEWFLEMCRSGRAEFEARFHAVATAEGQETGN